MGSTNRLIVSILIVTALAVAFWMLALGPKREEADQLATKANQLHASIAEDQSKAAEGVADRHDFPVDYRQLVDLGQAVPTGDETSSLLVELDQIAASSRVRFDSIQLSSSGEAAAEVPAPAPAPAPAAPSSATPPSSVPAAASVPPTEAAASLLPLGASIGPAGLATIPYDLSFSGNFFHVADFIHGIDSLIHTGKNVGVNGRLVTLNGFALNADPNLGFPHLSATFSVTTYLTPPAQGLTAGATPAAPAPETEAAATPAASTAPTEPSTATATPVSNAR